MKVYISECPSGSPPALLRGRFAADHGSFALLIGTAEKVRGKRTRKSVSIPFFHCLGKNLGTVGSYTGQTNEFRSLIQHWFTAYDAKHLVVFNGEVLYPGTMSAVFEYAAPVPDVTFVCEPGTYEKTRAAVHATGVATTRLDWDDLLKRLPRVPQPQPLPEPTYDMHHLPVTDFLLFRYEARILNTPEVFSAIDADYRRAYRHALEVETDLDAVVAMIANVTSTATITAPIMVALRATQAALLTRGWLLSANQDKAIGTLCAVRSPNPTKAHWRAIQGYVRTDRAAGVTLYLLDVPPGNLNNITLGDIATVLKVGHIDGRAIPDDALPMLKAHLSWRRSQGADDADPFLNQKGERRHLEDLIDARRHLGIPIDARFLRGGKLSHTHRPIYRFGLELRDLT